MLGVGPSGKFRKPLRRELFLSGRRKERQRAYWAWRVEGAGLRRCFGALAGFMVRGLGLYVLLGVRV